MRNSRNAILRNELCKRARSCDKAWAERNHPRAGGLAKKQSTKEITKKDATAMLAKTLPSSQEFFRETPERCRVDPLMSEDPDFSQRAHETLDRFGLK